MKFIIKEIKMWFNDKSFEPNIYTFEANKINVITGDSTKGKSSVISIIDYCFASKQSGISDDIKKRVSWFGVIVSINKQRFAIARKSTNADEYYLNENGVLPDNEPQKNQNQRSISSFLNAQFGLNPLSLKDLTINASFRNFLAFCSISEKFINNSDVVFERSKYDINDKNFQNVFYPALGVNLLKHNELSEIDKEIKLAENRIKSMEKQISDYRKELHDLNSFCENNQLKAMDTRFSPTDYEILKEIEDTYAKIQHNLNIKKQEVYTMQNRRNELQLKIKTYEQYKKEYKKNIENAQSVQDSLLPIETLKNKFVEEIVNFYDTKRFIDMLSESLSEIKQQLNSIPQEIIDEKYESVIEQYKEELTNINNEIKNINESQNIILTNEKLVAFGQVKYRFEILKSKIPDYQNYQSTQDSLQKLKDKRHNAKKEFDDINNEKRIKCEELNNTSTNFAKQFDFKLNDVRLKFEPQNSELQLYDGYTIINNWDSMAIRVFAKLSFYLGVHLHCLNVKSKYVPSFLIIDQPCLPFGDTDDDKVQKDNIFKILNDFMVKIKDYNEDFQFIILEHANESYWKDKYENFHTVDKFINGKGLLPKELF